MKGVLANLLAKKQELSELLALKASLEKQLLQVPVLRGLGAEATAQLVSALETLDFGSGEYIVEMGTVADALYLILAGEVACHQGGDSELRLAEGAFFGEACLSPAETPLRQAHVVAVTAVRVARLDWADEEADDFPCDVLLGADVCYSPLHAELLASVVRYYDNVASHRGAYPPITVFASLATRSDFGTLVEILEGDKNLAVTEHAITLLCHDADDERDAAGLGVAPAAPLEVAFRVIVVRART